MEIFDVFGPQPVPYKPLSRESRRSICMHIGMDFNVDWMQVSVSVLNIVFGL